MKLFQVLVSVVFLIQANIGLSNLLSDQSSRTYFEQIQSLFDKAGITKTVPKFSELTGYNAGRCFHYTTKNFSLASLLTAKEIKYEDRDSGPAFPDRTEMRKKIAIAIANTRTDADYFDSLEGKS